MMAYSMFYLASTPETSVYRAWYAGARGSLLVSGVGVGDGLQGLIPRKGAATEQNDGLSPLFLTGVLQRARFSDRLHDNII